MKISKNISYETILESIPLGVVYVEEGLISFCNTAAENILGISREKILGNSFFAQPFSENVISLFKRIKDSGKMARLYEEPFINYFGKKFILNISFVPVMLKKVSYVLVMEDCSFLKEMEAKSNEYSQIEKMSTLFASMAHEIKNPLGVIKGIIQLMEKENNAFDKEALHILISEVNRIEMVIQELLNYSNPQKVNISYVDINEVLDNIIKSMANELRNKGIIIVKEYDSTLPAFQADPESIYRALFNVFKNAVEASFNGGKITVRTKIQMDIRYKVQNKEYNYLCVEIIDGGEGIKQENMGKLFTPFFTTKSGGTGLGMVYIQKVILDHNGFLKINSIPNEGTTVSIFLPMRGVL